MVAKLIEEFKKDVNAIIKLGVEIEFYTTKKFSLEQIKIEIGCNDVDKEEGKNQYEARVGPSTKVFEVIQKLIKIQNTLNQNPNFNANPKPYANRPSNGMHIHLNLIDKDTHKNLYDKEGDAESEIFLYSIGGVLDHLPQGIPYFAPTKESFLRYEPGMNNPTKVCWGGNNRTVAIRVPPPRSGDRRLEHRVPASNCNIEKTIYAILEGVLYGIKNKILPGEKVYGNAFLEEYQYKKILDSIG